MDLHVYKSGTMQDMQAAVARGYHWHVSGRVGPARLPQMAAKFATLYETELSVGQRYRRRQAGRGVARLFVHPDYRQPVLHWWVLFTDGEHPAREREHELRDAREKRQRLLFQDNFELLRLQARGGASVWTWRLTREAQAEFSTRITEAVRRRRDRRVLKQVVREFHSLPGFRGVRHQVAALRYHTAGEWRRAGEGDTCPLLPTRMPPYLRFKSFPTVPMSAVCARLLTDEPPYTLEQRYGEARQANARKAATASVVIETPAVAPSPELTTA